MEISNVLPFLCILLLKCLVPPNITDISTNQTVNEGDIVALNCTADGNPAPNITWTRISDNSVVTMPLTINRSSEGGYRCTVYNSIGNPVSSYVFIDVQNYRPTDTMLTTNLTNNTVVLNKPFNLMCRADANPPAHYRLYKQQQPLTTITDNQAVGTLTTSIGERIQQVTYSCTPFNSFGVGPSDRVTVTVHYKPINVTLKLNMSLSKVCKGDVVEVKCKAEAANPAVHTYTLYKNGVMLENMSSTGVARRALDTEGQVTYKCEATNSVGTRASTNKTVFVKVPASVTSVSNTTVVTEGENVTLLCSVSGDPAPNVFWVNSKNDLMKVNSTWKILKIGRNYTGGYKCIASNECGIHSKTTNISVEFSPSAISSGRNGTVRLGTPVTFTCPVDGNPPPSVRWYKGSEPCGTVLSSRKEFEFTPNRLSDTGLYTCFANNYLGNINVSFGLEVVDPTSPATPSPTTPRGQTSSISTSSPSPTTDAGCAQGCKCSCSCNTVLGVIIGILVAIIIVLIIIIVWQYRKGTTKRPYEVPPRDAGFYDNEIAMKDVSPTHIPSSSSTQKLNMSGPGYMDLQEATRSDRYRTGQSRPTTSQQQNPSQPAEYAPLSLRTRSWEVARENVTVDKIIGKGAFGQVAKATATQLPFTNGKTTVAVKMLKPNAPEADKKDLLSELELMKTLKPHPHIIKLMGCVTLSEPLLVLIEYVPYGDLLGYLRKSRGLNDTYYKDPDVKPRTSLTSQQLMKFAWQIADGMSYLSSRKIIHRDLAARNVLVGERETCKVTDFGMARDVQQENIYEKKTKGRLPVKWTAYESLLYGTYTTKSDVWSYGVVLYEIFTIGGSPYPRMDGKRIANALQSGYRMPKPQHVDDALYHIMMNCWQKEPEARPSFPALTKQLKEMEKQHKRLINMHIYDNELYGNLEDLNV